MPLTQLKDFFGWDQAVSNFSVYLYLVDIFHFDIIFDIRDLEISWNSYFNFIFISLIILIINVSKLNQKNNLMIIFFSIII